VQGGSFSYLPATFGIIFNSELITIADDNERFERTMRTISGAVIIAGIVQIVIGYTGVMTVMLQFISPVTM
jgi:nucleobase transporter 1/2